MESTVHFWLNDKLVHADASHGLLVLDFLRKNKRLVGTKEGCKEGDCGACAIMIGELVDGQVTYQPVTSCLVPLGEMHGKHVVTIEGLNMKAALAPVQQAMYDTGGSQCGFCTPGFIVSMSWYLMGGVGDPSRAGMKRAISGNLCRCTGYSSIMRAGDILLDKFEPEGAWAHIWTAENRIEEMVKAEILPAYFKEMPERLRDLPPLAAPPASATPLKPQFYVAGGTDLYVQKGEHIPNSRVEILNRYPQMKGIRRDGDTLRIGALTTFEEFGQAPEVVAMIPRMDHYLYLIASLHLRNRATLSGNIINASPIGDMAILLLALDSQLTFRDEHDKERTVPMKAFFKGYKVMDKAPHEVMTEIAFPVGSARTKVHFEKASKRTCLDIATVNSAIRITTDDANVITDVTLTAGGVAAVPLWLEQTAKYLVGKPVSTQTLQGALPVAQREISPISDVRGSADYKRLLVRQFMIAHFTELYPELVEMV